MTDFIKSLKELERAQEIFDKMREKAISLGVGERNCHIRNVWSYLETQLKELENLRQQAEELGSSLPNIIKSYRMNKRPTEVLPPRFLLAPEHWIADERLERQTGWANGKMVEKLYKGRGVSALTAQNRCKRLHPVLSALLEQCRESGLHDYDEYVDAMVEAYQTLSYEEFVAEVFSQLRGFSQETGLSEEVITPSPVPECPIL
jgi:hypothetical protein